MLFDNFTPQFKAIVDLALEVVGDEERRAAAKRCPRRSPLPASPWSRDRYIRRVRVRGSPHQGELQRGSGHRPAAVRRRHQVSKSDDTEAGDSAAEEQLQARRHVGQRIGGSYRHVDRRCRGGGRAPPYSRESPVQSHSRPSTSGSSVRLNGSVDFGDNALGPGGNARWDARRESQASIFSRSQQQQQQQQQRKIVPEDKRVMVRAVEFDLRERFAIVQLGTRGLPNGAPDRRSRGTKIVW